VRGYLAVFEGYLYLMYVVVFIAMGFGIVNTILMAVMERMREFGLLQALGMKPVAIIKEVVLEACILLIIGMCIGNGIGCITGAVLSGIGIDLSAFAQGSEYVGMSRVIYPQLRVQDVAAANLVVFVLGVAVSLYPALKAARFHPVETLTRTQG
jgi:ABC-type lipoprotein release transport system permease subunit